MTKKLSVLTKFNNFIKRLNEHQQEDLYFILAALRGPDIDNAYDLKVYDLKSLTTARIRSFLNKSLLSFVCVNPDKLTTLEIQVRDKLLSDGSRHFKVHYIQAVAAIRDTEGYDLKTEQKVNKE